MMLRIRRSAAPGRVSRNARARVEDMLVPDAALTILTNLMHLVAVLSHHKLGSWYYWVPFRTTTPCFITKRIFSTLRMFCSVFLDTPQCQRTYLPRESRYGQMGTAASSTTKRST